MNGNVLGRTMVYASFGYGIVNFHRRIAHWIKVGKKKELEMDGEQNGILHNWMDVEYFRNETHFDTKKKKKESCR
jgi:hypothetical protein